MRYIICILIVLISLFACMVSVNASAEGQPDIKAVTVIYFYSSTCSSCFTVSDFLEEMKQEYPGLEIVKYNISDLDYRSLQHRYNEAYSVLKDDAGTVPVVFIRDRYFIGEKNIKENLKEALFEIDGGDTVIIKETGQGFIYDVNRFLNFKTLGVFGAGLVGGLNPCSMSMLLLFLSLLLARKVNILKTGLLFISGKFISYLLLGTIFFSVLSAANFSWLSTAMKYFVIAVSTVVILMNLNDYFASRNERYDRIKMQLPSGLRRLNHSIIKKTAFIIPLVLLTFIAYKGRQVYDLSEVIRSRMPAIKLVNALIFAAFIAITVLVY